MRKLKKLSFEQWILIIVAVGAAFIVTVGIFANKHNRDATQRCEAVGGVTWDSGSHCILGDFRTINTR